METFCRLGTSKKCNGIIRLQAIIFRVFLVSGCDSSLIGIARLGFLVAANRFGEIMRGFYTKTIYYSIHYYEQTVRNHHHKAAGEEVLE